MTLVRIMKNLSYYMKNLFIISLFLLSSLLFCQEKNQGADKLKLEQSKILENDLAKDFEVEMLDGQTIKLSDLRGKVVFLNFWATWCRPCLEEFDKIPSEILKPFKDRNFNFLPVSSGESEAKVRRKMEKLKNKGILFNTGFDKEKKVAEIYALKSIPQSYVIDQNGVIRHITSGYSEEGLRKVAERIGQLLEQN